MNTELGREHTADARTLLKSGEQKLIPSQESGGQGESSLCSRIPSTQSDFSCDEQLIVKHKQREPGRIRIHCMKSYITIEGICRPF